MISLRTFGSSKLKMRKIPSLCKKEVQKKNKTLKNVDFFHSKGEYNPME
jgi:hypothetical protein